MTFTLLLHAGFAVQTCLARAFLGLPKPVMFRGVLLVTVLLLATSVITNAFAGNAPADAPAAQNSAEDSDAARQYCSNIANAAADARFLRQKEALAATEKEIDGRLAQLEKKRAEYQDWLDRREVFLKKADDQLIAVISQMRPDAAASQVSAMNEDMAAALLAKLSPRVASAILNEVEPARAARLTSTMVGLARRMQESRKE